MTNLDGILKSRDITLSTKVRLVKALVFPVVVYGCESWTIKKGEHRRIDAFSILYWCFSFWLTSQRDGMGREVGGGFRMGNTCIPVADSF